MKRETGESPKAPRWLWASTRRWFAQRLNVAVQGMQRRREVFNVRVNRASGLGGQSMARCESGLRRVRACRFVRRPNVWVARRPQFRRFASSLPSTKARRLRECL